MAETGQVPAGVVRLGPQPGPQEKFLSTPATIAIFGGGAGGGKSHALLLEPLRHINNPGFGAVVFRRTSPQITNEGALWDESAKVYEVVGGKPNQVELKWAFPSGASVKFSHLQHEKNVNDWQGSQVPLFCFDELCHFSKKQFEYLVFSRGRSMCGVTPYVRATCNPDPDSWVKSFIQWWIDPETGYAIQERSGVLRWMIRSGDTVIWFNSQSEAKKYLDGCGNTETIPISVTFIASTVYDNKILLEKNPEYLSNLNALSTVEREQLKNGNWNVKVTNGLFLPDDIDRHRLAAVPAGVALTRITVAVDPPAKSRRTSDNAGIGTCARDDQTPPHYYVLSDDSMDRAKPEQWARKAVDAYVRHQADLIVGEGNNGGEMVEHTILTVDPNVPVKLVHASRGKRMRAEPVAVLLKQGRLHFVGPFPELERECTNWSEESKESPGRMDAMVWAVTDLMVGEVAGMQRLPLPDSWKTYQEQPSPQEGARAVAYLLPMGGKMVESQGHAVLVLGVIGRDEKFYVVMVWCEKAPPERQIDVVIKIQKMVLEAGFPGGLSMVRYGVLARDEAWIMETVERKRMEARALGKDAFPMMGPDYLLEKRESRVERLHGPLGKEQILFPEGFMDLAYGETALGRWWGKFIGQVKGFPFEEYAECPDALEGAFRLAKAIGPGLATYGSGIIGPREIQREMMDARAGQNVRMELDRATMTFKTVPVRRMRGFLGR